MHALNAFGKSILAGCAAAALFASPGLAHGHHFRVLYTFHNTDGASPSGGLIRDSAGNLYGTTRQGGGGVNRGVVFTLAPDGTETVLYTFCSLDHCTDGVTPVGGVIKDRAGNLYGTTGSGGTNCPIGGGCGTVFKIAPDRTETVLYNFGSGKALGTDGADPTSRLIRDAAGNLYGTTEYGGTYNYGVVFKLAPDGTETVLHAFSSGSRDGANPAWGVVNDEAGNLYGTTPYGGLGTCGQFLGCGVIFKIASDGAETILYKFGEADGAVPSGGLIMDKAGNFYGTTLYGGTGNEGVVYKLSAGGKETVLYKFSGVGEECRHGCGPFGPLLRDAAGNLYGVTFNGGKYKLWNRL